MRRAHNFIEGSMISKRIRHFYCFAVIRRLKRLGNMILLLPHLDISIHFHGLPGDIETTIDSDAIYVTVISKKMLKLCIFIFNARLIVFLLNLFGELNSHKI